MNILDEFLLVFFYQKGCANEAMLVFKIFR